MSEETNVKPQINVTPLIDVLLVLLIIFMLISPLKPSRFQNKTPSEPDNSKIPVKPNPNTLIVSVNSNYTLEINREKDFGTIADPQSMIAKLAETFKVRARK